GSNKSTATCFPFKFPLDPLASAACAFVLLGLEDSWALNWVLRVDAIMKRLKFNQSR
ncbi:hypothetical protein FIBSPDRAFT_855173, partial [Athelia psychrophila]